MTQTKLRDDQMSFSVSTGHDHDGTDSKKIAYANVTGTPTIPTVPSFETSASNIKADGIASVGSLSTLARADHVHPDNDSGWIDMTLLNGWAIYPSTGFAKYRKIGKTVYVEAYLLPTNASSNVFTKLPIGYIQSNNMMPIVGMKQKGITTSVISTIIYSSGYISAEPTYDATQDYYRFSGSFPVE